MMRKDIMRATLPPFLWIIMDNNNNMDNTMVICCCCLPCGVSRFLGNVN